MFGSDVENELQIASKKFPDYHSFHEGYAVLKEEIEELDEQFDKLKLCLNEHWIQIRHNDEQEDHINCMIEVCNLIYKELVQVGSVLVRHKKLFK